MSQICRFSDETARKLGSPVVITTPVTLVKELLDNAIDSQAASIEILVSPNTVDKIEVRDNGAGIHPDDYDSLGRRGHTSKLRTFEQLKTHGGKTLGFRGEALASINTMAQVKITTKRSSDRVAACLDLCPGDGGASKQRDVSAPVGTTVTVIHLFGRMPVREQMAIKESNKNIEKMKQLLKSYAMARPGLKLTFKILHTSKHNWTYSPRRDSGVVETAMQVFGRDLAAQCQEKTIVERHENDTHAADTGAPNMHQYLDADDERSYTLEALLIKPGADISKLPKQRYFSVDSRPILSKRGTFKKLHAIYLKYLKLESGQQKSTNLPSDCFIRLNIKGPPGSYDVNIEPAKDDVLFVDEEIVLRAFEGICSKIYHGDINMHSSIPKDSENDIASTVHSTPGVPAAITPPMEEERQMISPGCSNRNIVAPLAHHPVASFERVATNSIETEHPCPGRGTTPQLTTQGRYEQPSEVSPTFIASPQPENIRKKLPTKRPRVDMSQDFHDVAHNHNRWNKPRVPSESVGNVNNNAGTPRAPVSQQNYNSWMTAIGAATIQKDDNPHNGLDSRLNSAMLPMTPEPPVLRHFQAPPGDLNFSAGNNRMDFEPVSRERSNFIPGGAYRSPLPSPAAVASLDSFDGSIRRPNMIRRRQPAQPPWTPPSTIESSANIVHREPRRNGTHGNLKQTTISFQNPRAEVELEQSSPVHNLALPQRPQYRDSSPVENMAQVFSMTRKSLDTQLSSRNCQFTPMDNHSRGQARLFLEPGGKVSLGRQLHNKVGGPKEQGELQDKEPIKTTLAQGDPRAYLLRRQKSFAASKKNNESRKLRRMKSELLPLENTPTDEETRPLVCVTSLDIQALLIYVKELENCDKYIAEGDLDEGLDLTLDEVQLVEKRLQNLLMKLGHGDGVSQAAMGLNFGSLLKGKSPETG